MPVRWRLTLWQVALLALLLAGFAAVVYGAVSRDLRGQERDAVRARLPEVERAVVAAFGPAIVDRRDDERSGGSGSGRRGDDDQRGGPPFPAWSLEAVSAALAEAADEEDRTAWLLGPEGRVLATSDADLPAPAPDRLPPPGGSAVLDIGGQPMLAVRDPVTLGFGRGGSISLVLAEPTHHLDAALARLRIVLAVAVAGGVGLSLGVGWFVAGRALRPVDALTGAARAIGETGDLARRVPEPPEDDELRRLARTFNGMLARLDAAFAQQRRFLADAAHELRTPLTSVRADLDALRTHPEMDPAEREAALRAAERESARMGRLVDDLLALARADAGPFLRPQPVALDDLVLDVMRAAEPLANGARLDIGDWDQVALVADPDRVRQALLNLIDNALRHSPAGGTVTVGLARGDGAARISVRDEGPGISAEHLPRIFDRFYRADAARDRAAGGAGLGLAIAREIAEAHGGRIEVVSAPGAGSTFTLELPLPSA